MSKKAREKQENKMFEDAVAAAKKNKQRQQKKSSKIRIKCHCETG